MAYAAHLSDSGRVSPFWLVAVFLGIAVAELCISPVGLSMVTKIAPARVTGQVMGIWFVGNALANFLASQTVVVTTRFSEPQLFGFIAAVSLAGGLVLIFLRGPIRRLMGGAP
jgi:POT family proton-dependent oligopeptide transporter